MYVYEHRFICNVYNVCVILKHLLLPDRTLHRDWQVIASLTGVRMVHCMSNSGTQSGWNALMEDLSR